MTSELAAAETALILFCRQHGLNLIKEGEVGFGRPCVGLIPQAGFNYLDYNPYSMVKWDHVFTYDERLDPPQGVRAYHKHPCFAVLVDWKADDEDLAYGRALIELAAWVKHLQGLGDLQIVRYATGAEGMQALISGTVGFALRFKDPENELTRQAE